MLTIEHNEEQWKTKLGTTTPHQQSAASSETTNSTWKEMAELF